MDPPPPPPSSTTPVQLEQDDHDHDDWDTEGFVIPSLGIENPDQDNFDAPEKEESKVPPLNDKLEKIYLGPHGAPPQQKQPEPTPSNRKKHFKQKLKEADRRTGNSGRENKVESLRELVGGSGKASGNIKGTSREWLDPHCNESEFLRRRPQ